MAKKKTHFHKNFTDPRPKLPPPSDAHRWRRPQLHGGRATCRVRSGHDASRCARSPARPKGCGNTNPLEALKALEVSDFTTFNHGIQKKNMRFHWFQQEKWGIRMDPWHSGLLTMNTVRRLSESILQPQKSSKRIQTCESRLWKRETHA